MAGSAKFMDAIRTKVDEEAKKGMFILTGLTSINKNSYIHRTCFFTHSNSLTNLKPNPE